MSKDQQASQDPKAPESLQAAVRAAWAVRAHAHAPYSKFKVGAAVQLKGVATPVVGCNVENASFGATVCAERSAILSAVAAYGKIEPEYIVVATNESKATVPCALCLQVMAEFCSDQMPVYLANEQGPVKTYRLKDLLPHPFRSFAVVP
jgi:cytidine deaminase